MNDIIYNSARELVEGLTRNSLTIATAESCTGGMLSAYITAVPGSSSVIEMGLVSYSCRIKAEILGVKPDTLKQYGAISTETAYEMAENIRRISGADIGLSVTGAAGPDGSEGHAPGLVYIGISDKNGTKVKELNIEPLSRHYVRESAAADIIKLTNNLIRNVEYETRKRN